VDDEPFVRRAASRILESAGHEVVTAEDGTSALALLQGGEQVDAVLLDLTMPGMNGAEAWKRMCAIGLEAPVVVMSGYAAREITQRFGGRELAGVIRKPFSAQQLLSTMDEALFGRMVSGSNMPVPTRLGATVLVVDDEPGVRRTCNRILGAVGYEVMEAEHGARALELLEEYGSVVDLIVLDMMMPVLDGADTFQRLLDLGVDVPVLFFCGQRIDQMAPALLEAGAVGVVRKPITAEALQEEVARALRAHRRQSAD
jgi:CheY-like chemotaxis protein